MSVGNPLLNDMADRALMEHLITRLQGTVEMLRDYENNHMAAARCLADISALKSLLADKPNLFKYDHTGKQDELQHLLNAVNRVTSNHRHGEKVTRVDLNRFQDVLLSI